MNKYFIYCRKSSEQEDRQMLSLDSQETELCKVAHDDNLEIVDTYKESGSAHTVGRKQFGEMLSRIENGEANGIIVWDEARLARNSKDGGNLIYMIDLGQIVEIRKPGKTYKNTPDDKSWLGMIFTMTKKDSDDKGVNVKRGLKTKAEKGWIPSGAKPGYMNDKYAEKGNKTIVIDEMRFKLIRKAWDYMLTGIYNVAQIKELLDEWGYRTPKRKRIGGKPISLSYLYKVFTDPFYYGEFEYPTSSGNWYKGKHKPMISRDEFERVQRLLGRKISTRSQTREFDYTGLFECGECGATITAEDKVQCICSECKYKFSCKNALECPKCTTAIKDMTAPKILEYVYYHCTKRVKPNCTQRSLTKIEFEKQIDSYLSKIQISESFKEWAIKYLNELNQNEIEDRNSIIDSLQEAYKDCVKRIDNLVALKISPQNSDGNLLTDEEFKKQKESLIKEKSVLEERMNNSGQRINKWLELSEKAFNFACYARYWFANGTRQQKRDIFYGLGSNLKLFEKIVRIDVEKPLEMISEVRVKEKTISPMFEPSKRGYNKGKLEAYWSQNPTMLAQWNDYRNLDWQQASLYSEQINELNAIYA